jgi:hypothetical protein
MTAGTFTVSFCWIFDPAPPVFSTHVVPQVMDACCAGEAFT